LRPVDYSPAFLALFVLAVAPQIALAQWANVCHNQENGSRLALATHCARFVVCQNGDVSLIGSCPRGLHFNRELGECDFQWRVNCQGLEAFAAPADQCTCDCCAEECSDPIEAEAEADESTTAVTEDCDPVTTTTPAPQTEPTDATEPTETPTDIDQTTNASNATNTTPSSPNMVAPSYCASSRTECANEDTGTLLEMPGVCVRFIQCSNGCVEEIQCPGGTYFSAEVQRCDNWWTVDCTITADASNEIEGPSGTTCTDQGVCAQQKDGVMIADKDSNGYFVCQCQCPIAMTCSSGLKFNETAQVCDWDKTADAEDDTLAVLCPNDLVYNATSNECDYASNYVPEVACNTTDVDVCKGEPEGTLFPVEGKCNMFYKCNYNCAVEQYCPNNLIYDSTTEICDYPQNVKCEWEYTPPSGPSAGPSGTACESNGRCLNQNEGVLFPSTTSCSGYVVCQCECEVEMECPEGLQWDTNLKTCNYASVVKCTI
ncbi:hypothetical protein KR018_007862, partial [Drosophila ironensis]